MEKNNINENTLCFDTTCFGAYCKLCNTSICCTSDNICKHIKRKHKEKYSELKGFSWQTLSYKLQRDVENKQIGIKRGIENINNYFNTNKYEVAHKCGKCEFISKRKQHTESHFKNQHKNEEIEVIKIKVRKSKCNRLVENKTISEMKKKKKNTTKNKYIFR